MLRQHRQCDVVGFLVPFSRRQEVDDAGRNGLARRAIRPNFLLCNTIKPLKYQDSLSKIGKIVAM
jgi:hypothetical protein